MSRMGLRAALLASVALTGACDLLLTDPAPSEPAVSVSFSVTSAASAVDDAFDQVDRVYLLLIRPDSATRDTVLRLDPQNGVARARLVLETKERVPALGIYAQLRAGSLPLFEGATIARVESGAPTSVEIEVAPVVASLRVTPRNFEVAVGDTLRLTAQGLLATGDVLTDVPVLWLTTNPEVAVVNLSGLVLGRTPGDVGIIARFGEAADTVMGRVLKR